jgi:predicted MFS family arabinose efflux permease
LTAAGELPARKPIIGPEWQLVAFLWVCYVLNHADRQVVYSLFPALQKTFGYSNAVLGLTGALFLWIYGLCSPLAGIWGDSVSKSRLVVGSLIVWSTFTVLTGFSPNGSFLLGCRALLGVSESMFMPAAYALMAAAHGPATRSRAIALFGTSQLIGVAAGGSISAWIAERLHWRVSFWLLGAFGILFAFPLRRFLKRMPEAFKRDSEPGERPGLSGFFVLFRIPSLCVIMLLVSVATFGLFLVYTWLPTFLFDKFKIGLARAGFEASVYPQIGTAFGLLVGGWLADRYSLRIKAARLWVIVAALFCGAPFMFLLGAMSKLAEARLAAMAVGFFAGFVNANQVAAAFDVVPAKLRASTVGVLNLTGAIIAGFAPFLGGLARQTIGVDRLMAFTAATYLVAGAIVVFGILKYFERDRRMAQE